MTDPLKQSTGIVFCRCSVSDCMPVPVRSDVEDIFHSHARDAGDSGESTRGSGLPVPLLVVDDLCGLMRKVLLDPQKSMLLQALQAMASSCSRVVFVACAPRAVENLLLWSGLDAWLPDRQVLSLRDQRTPGVLKQLLENMGETGIVPSRVNAEGEWIPWYPVIDRETCVNCGKCFDFCLFGVYERDGEEVRVAHPENCKNNCPACARICPVKAIIFPKFGNAPINGEAVLEKTSASRENPLLEQRKAERRRLFSRSFEKKLDGRHDSP